MTIAGKSLGNRRPLFADFSVPVFPDGDAGEGGLTLRELITRIVLHEVAQFRQRQDRRQFLRVLSAREIDDGVAKGKIDAGGSEVPPQAVDEEQVVGAALQAFEDGLYLVVIDGEEHRELDRQVYLKPDSRVTFVRLVFLAGA